MVNPLKLKDTDVTNRAADSSLRRQPVFAKSAKEVQDSRAIGGLRNPRISVSKVHGLSKIGKEMSNVFDKFLDSHPDAEKRCINAIGSEDPNAGPLPEDVEKCRKAIALHLDCNDVSPVKNSVCQIDIRASLLGALARAAKDPGRCASKHKAVAPEDGVFPPAEQEDLH